MTIRWLSEEDYERVIEIRKQHPLHPFFATREELRKLLSEPLTTGIVLVSRSDTPLAYLLYTLPKAEGPINLLEVATHKLHQRCGYAQKLIAWVLERGKHHDVVSLVSEDYLAAHKLLASLGFKAVRVIPQEKRDLYHFTLDRNLDPPF